MPAHFPWEKFLPNVIVVRLKPGHAASTNAKPGPEVSGNLSSTESSWGASIVREASDIAEVSLPVLKAAVGAIPLVGPPMQAVIDGVLAIIQAVDRSGQNKADLSDLTARVYELICHLSNAPLAQNLCEESRRESITKKLQEISDQLTKLRKRRFGCTSVTQAIAACSSKIDRCLSECLLLSNMQIQRNQNETLANVQKLREENQNLVMTMQAIIIHGQSSAGTTATQLPVTISLGCVILLDATGHEHSVPMNFCASFQQFTISLTALFQGDSIEAQIQRRYMKEGQYDLCIDEEGMQVTQLTSDGWSRIEAGTKIVMRVIFEQLVGRFSARYKCHFCETYNEVDEPPHSAFSAPQHGRLIDCRVCKQRFQISVNNRDRPEKRGANVDSNHAAATEMDLIRNFHVQQIETTGLLSCRWFGADGMPCGFEGELNEFETHFRRSHLDGPRDAPFVCLWEGCTLIRRGNPAVRTMRRDNAWRHTLERHLGMKRRSL